MNAVTTGSNGAGNLVIGGMIVVGGGGGAGSAGIGDINGTEKGTGARYNAGKTPFMYIPFRLIADTYLRRGNLNEMQHAAAEALQHWGDFQARTRGREAILDAIDALGLATGWPYCARVFEYGAKKYAAHNWCRGMKWSAVLECGARHLIDILEGAEIDVDKDGAPGSQLPHVGHFNCNAVMVLTYLETYPEGDDRPAAGLLGAKP